MIENSRNVVFCGMVIRSCTVEMGDATVSGLFANTSLHGRRVGFFVPHPFGVYKPDQPRVMRRPVPSLKRFVTLHKRPPSRAYEINITEITPHPPPHPLRCFPYYRCSSAATPRLAHPRTNNRRINADRY